MFAHEESEVCKFGNLCERKLCMYRHEESNAVECESDEDTNDEYNDMEINDTNFEKVEPVLEKF